jgi:AcrR family transcriptional regulator
MNKYSFSFAPVKPRDEKKAEQIFKALPKLVTKNGLAGVTMSDIAKEAKIATGTLYIYYKNKEELINAVFTECRQTSFAKYFEGFDEDAPFKQGFKKVWMNIVSYRLQHFDEAIFMEQCHHSPFITQTTRQLVSEQVKPLYGLMERGKNEKLIKEAETLMLLMFMMASVNEVVKYIRYTGKKLTDDIIETSFGFCWDGIKA